MEAWKGRSERDQKGRLVIVTLKSVMNGRNVIIKAKLCKKLY